MSLSLMTVLNWTLSWELDRRGRFRQASFILANKNNKFIYIH